MEDRNKEIEDRINSSSGYQLNKFFRKVFFGCLGNVTKEINAHFAKICMTRIKELNKDRFGDWEEAKINLDHLEEPNGVYESTSLPPILGYPCEFIIGKTKRLLVINNGKTNSAYVRNCDGVDLQTATRIFNS